MQHVASNATSQPTVEHITSARANEVAATPIKYQGVIAKAFEGNSKAAALKARCLQCCQHVRAEVTNCSTVTCALWSYRPYQKGTERDSDEPNAEEMPANID